MHFEGVLNVFDDRVTDVRCLGRNGMVCEVRGS